MNSREYAQAFVRSAAEFSESCDFWIRRYPSEAKKVSWSRADFQRHGTVLLNIRDALRWGPSIGLFGESQCGKSNLVSRFAKGLGAPSTPSGSLLIADPTPAEKRASRPWNQGAAAYEGIEFASWIDPAAAKEATGIVCRFTRVVPADLQPGHFLVELMSQAELVSSLALGYDAEIKERGEGRHQRLEHTLKRLRSAPREDDPERIMGQLVEAWNFLSADNMLGGSGLIQALDNGDEGWDDFARECFSEGKRPRFDRGADASDLDEFVGLLWDSVRPLTRIWRKLSLEQRRLGDVRSIWVPAEAVCKDKPRGGERMSLVAVDWIHRVFEEGSTSCVVRYKLPRAGGFQAASMPHAAIVALAREMVFPVGSGACAESELLDVLDYPGARNEERNIVLGQAEEDPQKAREGATQAFLRGKINRLFVSAVDYHDSTALCLVLSGAGGNPAAGRPVVRALRRWLNREGWDARNGAADGAEEPGAPATEPPFAVAVSKSDLVFGIGPEAFNAKIGQLKEKYCEGLDWMERWWERQPFTNIHWVHNPDAVGAKKPSDYPGDQREATIQRCLELPEFNRHVAEPEHRLRALVGTSEHAATDVQDLFENLRGRIDSRARVTRLVDRALGELEQMVAKVHAVYLGHIDRTKAEAERELSRAHVQSLRRALRKDAAVSSFLRALEMPSWTLEKAYKKAAHLAGDDNEGNGEVDFEAFYDQLLAAFAERLDKGLHGDAAWLKELRRAPSEGVQTSLADISARFGQMPSAPWFRNAMKGAVGQMIEAHDPANVPVHALGSIGSAVWNRNMVWLGLVPEAKMRPADSPPKLRSRNAASVSILDHWEQRLGDAYVSIYDPQKRNLEHNRRLGEYRQKLLQAVRTFQESVSGTEWGQTCARLEKLRRDLEDGDQEGGA